MGGGLECGRLGISHGRPTRVEYNLTTAVPFRAIRRAVVGRVRAGTVWRSPRKARAVVTYRETALELAPPVMR